MSSAIIVAVVVEPADLWDPQEQTLEGESVPNSTAERGSYSANSFRGPQERRWEDRGAVLGRREKR